MKYPLQLIIAVLVLLLPSFASADLILSDHSYESGAVGAGVSPPEMNFTGTFGAQDSTFFGISDVAPRTGSQSYFINMGNNGSGPTFGGSFSGVNHTGLAGTLTSNTSYTVSAWFRNDAATPFTGGGEVNVHLEFFDSSNALLFRTDSAGIHAQLFSGGLTTTYQQLSHTYQLNNTGQISDAGLVNRVAAVVTGSNGLNTGSGIVYVDDFQFSTSVPEPGSLVLFGSLAGLLGLQRRRR